MKKLIEDFANKAIEQIENLLEEISSIRSSIPKNTEDYYVLNTSKDWALSDIDVVLDACRREIRNALDRIQ